VAITADSVEAKPASSEGPKETPAARREVKPVFKRVERAVFSDVYNLLLALPLGWMIVLVAGLFLACNLVFAGLFMIDPKGSAGIKGFADAFFLSVQTIGNVNLGFGAPSSDYARWVMTAEVFVGLLALALGTGLFFAKISQPSARISFSRTAVISDYEGRPALMFRVGNRRTNAILDVKVMINIARQVRTKEGQSLRRFEELNPVKASAPLFAYTWTIVCPIDEASPLYGLSADDLADQHAEIIVVLGGVDDRFNQSVYARCSYTPDEIFFGRRFADVLSVRPDGRWVVDYGRFHDTVQT
jgi:inward rectifier potassium channel